jgi:phosphatidylserine/phosphatidylglycerophosphate/cardiolipin synthase-like enzyme
MELQFISSAEVSAALKRLMQAHSQFYWATAWGSDNSALSELIRQRSKIVKLVIGTHFYQTPPDFLANFEGSEAVRAVPPQGIAGTFHPKTYLFVSAERSAALIGSANFTRAAMESNVEACCLIEGESSESFFHKLRHFIEEECWRNAKSIDKDFLRDYRIQYEAKKASAERPWEIRFPKAATGCGAPG